MLHVHSADHPDGKRGVVRATESLPVPATIPTFKAPKVSKNHTFPRSNRSARSGIEMDDVKQGLYRRQAVIRRTSRGVTRELPSGNALSLLVSL